MNVTLRAAATDSDPVTVMTPHGGELMGIWRGVNAPEGACVHVEVDVADAVAWHTIERTAPGTPVLATHADGVTTVRGRLVDLSTDGVLVLDLSPGIILIDTTGRPPPLRRDQFLELVVTAIALHPTGY